MMSELTHRNKDFQMMFNVDHHTTLVVNILFKTSIFKKIGKKNKTCHRDRIARLKPLGHHIQEGHDGPQSLT